MNTFSFSESHLVLRSLMELSHSSSSKLGLRAFHLCPKRLPTLWLHLSSPNLDGVIFLISLLVTWTAFQSAAWVLFRAPFPDPLHKGLRNPPSTTMGQFYVCPCPVKSHSGARSCTFSAFYHFRHGTCLELTATVIMGLEWKAVGLRSFQVKKKAGSLYIQTEQGETEVAVQAFSPIRSLAP